MKRINIIISALAISALAASCTKESPSKSEVEAGFPNRFQGEIPEVSFSATPSGDAKFDAKTFEIYVDTKVTVSGLGDNLDKVVIGIISSQKADFSNPKSTSLEISEDGTYDVRALVNANNTNYLQASVSTPYGCSYSEAVKVSVSDVPFYAKLVGKWEGVVTSLVTEDEYTSTITILPDKKDPENVCYVCDIEPLYAIEGEYTYEDTGLNIIQASIDAENQQIVIATGSDMTLGGPLFFATDLEGKVVGQATLKLSADGSSLVRAEAFYTVAGGKPENWYSPAEYKKK